MESEFACLSTHDDDAINITKVRTRRGTSNTKESRTGRAKLTTTLIHSTSIGIDKKNGHILRKRTSLSIAKQLLIEGKHPRINSQAPPRPVLPRMPHRPRDGRPAPKAMPSNLHIAQVYAGAKVNGRTEQRLESAAAARRDAQRLARCIKVVEPRLELRVAKVPLGPVGGRVAAIGGEGAVGAGVRGHRRAVAVLGAGDYEAVAGHVDGQKGVACDTAAEAVGEKDEGPSGGGWGRGEGRVGAGVGEAGASKGGGDEGEEGQEGAEGGGDEV